MCEKRMRKIKKGAKGTAVLVDNSYLTRLRETRRMQRLLLLAFPPIENPNLPPANRQVQNRVFLHLAWKTVELMYKNRLIQARIIALQKETSEYIATVLSNSEYKERYLEYLRLNGLTPPPEVLQHLQKNNI